MLSFIVSLYVSKKKKKKGIRNAWQIIWRVDFFVWSENFNTVITDNKMFQLINNVISILNRLAIWILFHAEIIVDHRRYQW